MYFTNKPQKNDTGNSLTLARSKESSEDEGKGSSKVTDHQLDQVEAGGWVEVSKTDGYKEIVKIITEASMGRVAVSQELSW